MFKKLCLKFLTLAFLVGCLAFMASGRDAHAEGDFCISQYNTCTSGCPIAIPLDAPTAACEMGCMQQLSGCTEPPVIMPVGPPVS